MSNPAVKELLLQHMTANPSPSKPASNAAPVNSPTTAASPTLVRSYPTFVPGSGSVGSGAFSVPGRQKDRPSPRDDVSNPRFDAASSSSPVVANTSQRRPVATGVSPVSSPFRDADAQIQSLRSKLSEEQAARLASEAIADDLHRQLQARDFVVNELHKEVQQLEQQLLNVTSTLERSAEDALHVERSIRSRNASDDKRRLLTQQLHPQQHSQLRQEPSPSRHASSNGSAFVPSSGSGGPTSSARSPAIPSREPFPATAFDGQPTTFIKVN